MGSHAERINSYTTFGIGGEARAILAVKKPEELLRAISSAKENKIPFKLIAGGSNVVFPDKFYDGLVIVFRNPFGKIKIEGEVVECDASLPLARLISGVIKSGLAGLETLSGIPGTVGGAIVGNAGAYGQNISDHLMAVEIWDGKTIKWLEKKECQFAYRDSVFKHKNSARHSSGLVVLRAKFRLIKGDQKELAKKSREIIKVRYGKYDPALRCPGSFFKNVLVKNVPRTVLGKIDPSKIWGGEISVGYLLESVGAKGMKVGGIYVADFHGNFLINDGRGTYSDVKKMAAKLKQKVKKQFGINLEEEVRYMI